MKISIIATITLTTVALAVISTFYFQKENNLKEEVCYSLIQTLSPWDIGDTRKVNIVNDCPVYMRFTIIDTSGNAHSTYCIPPDFSDYTGLSTKNLIKAVEQSTC